MVVAATSEFKRYLSNTSWMLIEKVTTLGLGLLATIFLARSFGPEKFGLYNYAIALVALVGAIAHLGFPGLAVKEIRTRPGQQDAIFTSIFTLKSVAVTVGILVVTFIAFRSSADSEHFWVLFVAGLSLIIKPFETINYWFQAKVIAKYSVISNITGASIGNVLKIIVAISGGSVLLAVGVHSFIAIVTSILLLLSFLYKNKNYKLAFSLTESKLLLKKGSLIFMGSLSAIIYLKIDQIMLQHMMGEGAVGQYAAAAMLSEAWYFIPVTILASVFPKIIEKSQEGRYSYENLLQIIFDSLFLGALCLSIVIFIVADDLVDFLYGSKYSVTSSVLSVHIFASIFIFMRELFSKWIIVEELFIFSLVTHGAGAVSNVILNFFFINEFGIIGAAYATFISYGIAGYISLYFSKRTRGIFKMMSKSIMCHFLVYVPHIWEKLNTTSSR